MHEGGKLTSAIATDRPAAPTGQTLRCVSPLVGWLLTAGWDVASPAELVQGLAERLSAAGVPLSRLTVLIRTLHPQVLGVRYEWRRGGGPAAATALAHDGADTSAYRDSPVATICEGGATNGIRRRLDAAEPRLDYPLLAALQAAGATDYLALPVVFSDGTVNAVSFTCDRPGGLGAAALGQLEEMLPVLARLLETHALRRTARTLLDTYLGRHTGARVLDGQIKRGDGEDIHAAIWFCDLRDSTPMAERLSRRAYLGVLNDFFDCMAGAVLDHGGEVLSFVGDAAVAIFPTGATASAYDDRCCGTEGACQGALEAAWDARQRMAALNRARAARGLAPLGFGLGLHMGNLMYGNVGVPGRLEFTVVGAAANEAARIQGLCKTLGQPIPISGEFQGCFPGELMSLGHHALRGLRAPRELFTLPAQWRPTAAPASCASADV